MRMTSFLTAAALCMAGCAAQTALASPAPAPAASAASLATAQANLDGTQWRFIEVNGVAVPAGVTATLHLHDGRASGKAGCNAYGAAWERSANGSTKFGSTLSTKMACLQPAGAMQVERGVFDALGRTARIQRNGDTLVLLDATGKPLAKLARSGAP